MIRAAVLLLLGTTAALADPVKQVGVDATVSIPLSPWSHATGAGGGGSIWLHLPVAPFIEVIARLGAIVHAERPIDQDPDARSRISEVPLLGGARVQLTDGPVRGYLEGEVGLIFRRVDVDVQGLSDDSARIRLASSLGAAIEIDRFEVRAAVWLADLADLDHAIGIVVSAGARFYEF